MLFEKGSDNVQRYDFIATVLQRFAYRRLGRAERFLKPGITFEGLDRLALGISDNEAAQRLNEARTRLFQSIHRRPKHAA